MRKIFIRLVILTFSVVSVNACSDASQDSGDPCATANPPAYCEVSNNENNLNNGNNENNMNNKNNGIDLLCDPACSGDTPVCLDGACVECSAGAECESGVCDGTTNTCAGCVDHDECSGITPRCDDSGICVACDASSNEGCEGSTPYCEVVGAEALCVECTASSEAMDCNRNVCDPSTLACTNEGIGVVIGGEPCISDTSCEQDTYCIPLEYEGSLYGNYCMPKPGTVGTDPGCPRPFGAGVSSRTTTSGKTVEVCMINEAVTTIDALRVTSQRCTLDVGPRPGECGINGVTVPGARCVDGVCTHDCASDADCLFEHISCGPSARPYCGG